MFRKVSGNVSPSSDVSVTDLEMFSYSGNEDATAGRKNISGTSERTPEQDLTQSEYQRVIFKVFTAVTMKNVVFSYIKTQFVPHRRHITIPLQSQAV
jgi:hypothetical protein